MCGMNLSIRMVLRELDGAGEGFLSFVSEFEVGHGLDMKKLGVEG